MPLPPPRGSPALAAFTRLRRLVEDDVNKAILEEISSYRNNPDMKKKLQKVSKKLKSIDKIISECMAELYGGGRFSV